MFFPWQSDTFCFKAQQKVKKLLLIHFPNSRPFLCCYKLFTSITRFVCFGIRL